MRITLELPDELIEKAMQLSQSTTPAEAITKVLQEMIR